MTGANFKLGRQLAEPAVFEPTASWQDEHYIYRIDTKRRICCAQEKHVNSKSAYYRIKLGSGVNWRKRVSRVSISVGVAALLLMAYPYYPTVEYGLRQSFQSTNSLAVDTPVTAANQLIIPKIGVTANILESESLDILNHEQGVWHQTGAVSGNFVLAGHRFKYLPPNTTTFYNLDKLGPGDTAVIDYGGKRLVYVVKTIRTVKEKEISVLDPSDKSILTLYTCSDKRETERIVVQADLLP